MIRHILKLMWNRKRSLAWIFIEQLLVFAVLLFILCNLSENIAIQLAKGTVRMDNIVTVGFNSYETQQEDEREESVVQLRNMLERMKEWQSVECVSITYCAIPGTCITDDSLRYRENSHRASIKYCDENYARMFSLSISEGEWFRDSDAFSETPPALITQLLADNMGITGSAIGQTIVFRGRTYRITGIVEAFKEKLNRVQAAALFMPVYTKTDDSFGSFQYAVKYKSGMSADFSRAFYTEFYRYFPRDEFQPELIDRYKMRKQEDFINVTVLHYMQGIPTAFLLIFAFMGTFGVVWMQSKKRMSELGLRIALGCTPARLQRIIIFENLILTTLAMLPGLIVAANLYAFAPKGWEWTAAVGAAVVLMWLFSAFSAWYPARQAAKVQPVEALKANQ